jgi:thioredoxin 1
MSIRVEEATFEQEVVQAEGLVLAEFYSDSCLPCKRLAATLPKVEAAHDDLKVVKINVKYDKELTQRYGVLSTPTLLYLRKGEELDRQTGAVRQQDIEEKLEALL